MRRCLYLANQIHRSRPLSTHEIPNRHPEPKLLLKLSLRKHKRLAVSGVSIRMGRSLHRQKPIRTDSPRGGLDRSHESEARRPLWHGGGSKCFSTHGGRGEGVASGSAKRVAAVKTQSPAA